MLVSCRGGGGGILKLRIDRRMRCLQESLKKIVAVAYLLNTFYCYFILDLAKTKVDSSDLNALQRDNVWCLKPDYIAEYLMQDPPPPPQKYLLSEPVIPGEQDRSVPGQSRKRKGDDLTGGDKRVRV